MTIYRCSTFDLARMKANDCVMALGTDKAGLLPVVRATMLVIADAISERHTLSDALPIEKAVEKDPLAAVRGPSLAAEGLFVPGHDDLGFELSQMLAGHGLGSYSPHQSASCVSGQDTR